MWLEKVNEQLIEGREDIYFGFEFEHRTVKKLPQYALGHYIEHFAASREAYVAASSSIGPSTPPPP